MTIEERAKSFAKSRGINFATDMRAEAYTQGATEQREIDIEKACEWLRTNVNNYLYNTGERDEYIPKCGDKMFSDFEKAMEDK